MGGPGAGAKEHMVESQNTKAFPSHFAALTPQSVGFCLLGSSECPGTPSKHHTSAIPAGSGRVFTLDSVVSTQRAKPPAVGLREGHNCHLACVVNGGAVADESGVLTCPLVPRVHPTP